MNSKGVLGTYSTPGHNEQQGGAGDLFLFLVLISADNNIWLLIMILCYIKAEKRQQKFLGWLEAKDTNTWAHFFCLTRIKIDLIDSVNLIDLVNSIDSVDLIDSTYLIDSIEWNIPIALIDSKEWLIQ